MNTYLTRRRIQRYGHVRKRARVNAISEQRDRMRGKITKKTMAKIYRYHLCDMRATGMEEDDIQVRASGAEQFNRLSVDDIACQAL